MVSAIKMLSLNISNGFLKRYRLLGAHLQKVVGLEGSRADNLVLTLRETLTDPEISQITLAHKSYVR